jgi:hypothetical protein
LTFDSARDAQGYLSRKWSEAGSIGDRQAYYNSTK